MVEKAQVSPKTVCILTAGKGGRLKYRTEYFNKALLRVGNEAVISHIIEEFPNDSEFVIALGYKGDIVKQYLEICYPEKKFIFVHVDKYSEPRAGPGYAINKCREYLQKPFFFVSCDSIVDLNNHSEWQHWDLLNSDVSWAGINTIDKSEASDFCTIEAEDNIVAWHNKSPIGTTEAFIGVAFVQEYEEFWNNLDNESFSENGEMPIAPSILSLSWIKPVDIGWFDTGSEEGLLKARACFGGIDNLDKVDEELYIFNKHVVKYFHNENMVKHRAARLEHLGGMGPKMIEVKKNFYKYEFVEGNDLFRIPNPQDALQKVLEKTQKNLWSHRKKLSPVEQKIFFDTCQKFYYDKTIARLNKLYKKINISNTDTNKVLKKVNWKYLSEGIPTRMHGDFNFSNIVWGKNQEVILLDWRQDFGGSIEYGDAYYDFAKMYHSFLFPHPSIKKDRYYVKKKGDKIKTFIEIPYEIQICKDIFEEFVEKNGYDLWKVKVLTAIVLLNMSPLHESPIDEYLYYFAKQYLEDVLSE